MIHDKNNNGPMSSMMVAVRLKIELIHKMGLVSERGSPKPKES